VCGAVARTLNESAPTGGLAVPFRFILACYPELSSYQSDYHKRNPQWRLSDLVVPTGDLTDSQMAQAVLAYPEGPGVPLGEVPPELIAAFYSLDAGLSNQTVQQANNLRLRSRREGVRQFAITLDLGSPAVIGVVEYWREAFARAAPRGPRMLAALLYAAPPGTMAGLDQTVLDFLAKLRTWPIA
jgi:hypothetical protein